jgi:signal peptidase II
MARPYWTALALFTLPFYLLDQGTKWAILRWLEPDGSRPVIPGFFTLVHWYNTGAAFSLFSNSNAFFLALSSVAIAVLLFLARRGKFHDGVSRAGWALLLAGIFGNLTDRIAHGHVVDFLLFDLHVPFANPWPAFNVADACICTAAGLFFLQSLREPR